MRENAQAVSVASPPTTRSTKHVLKLVKRLMVIGCLLIPGSTCLLAQEAVAHDALTTTVARLDTALFDAYNACDLKRLAGMIANDLEFFHDKDGLAVGRQAFIESTRKNICGKVRRDLVPGTLEVYPLGDYGALEVGVHRFHHPGADNDDIGQGKFMIIWHRRGNGWTMTRTISYAHEPVPR